MNFKDFIIRDPKVRGGIPIIKGTDIPLKTLLEHLVLGDTSENILKAYPELKAEALQAVIALAAAFAKIDLPDEPPREIPAEAHTPPLEKLKDLLKDKKAELLSDEKVSALLSGFKFTKA